jgi:AcrR family transcriptional regulator
MSSNVKSAAAMSKPRGRPRSQTARKAILSAANALLEEGGLGAVTMEAVAARAGVGKPTIYRSWPNRHALSMAALIAAGDPDGRAGAACSPLARLRAQLEQIAERFETSTGRHIASLLATADSNTELAKAFRTHFILARRAEGRTLLEAAQSKGRLPQGLDLDVVLDALYGAVFFRLLIGHERLDRKFIATLVDNILTKPFGEF